MCWKKAEVQAPNKDPKSPPHPGNEESSSGLNARGSIPAQLHGGSDGASPSRYLPRTKVLRVPHVPACPSVLRGSRCAQGGAVGRSMGCWSYTMFSAPGRGPCGGPGSCCLCSCASCSTGMLQSGQTLRTSSHLMRHLRGGHAQGKGGYGVLRWETHSWDPNTAVLSPDTSF